MSEDRQNLRQATEEFSVVFSDLAALAERIKLLKKEIAARVNEDNNRSLLLLTIVTVMALPINLVAGLLEMNVGGVPLAHRVHGYWIAYRGRRFALAALAATAVNVCSPRMH